MPQFDMKLPVYMCDAQHVVHVLPQLLGMSENATTAVTDYHFRHQRGVSRLLDVIMERVEAKQRACGVAVEGE